MMPRRKGVWTLAIALALWPALAHAQDLSGTWKLDKAKTIEVMRAAMRSRAAEEQFGGRGGRRRGGSGGDDASDEARAREMLEMREVTLTIAQTPETVTLRFDTGARLHHLDGREDANPGVRGGDMKSKAKWDGRKLKVESHQDVQGPDGRTQKIRLVEEFALARDGQTLNYTRTNGASDRTFIFTKQ